MGVALTAFVTATYILYPADPNTPKEPDYPCTLYIYGSYDQHKHEASRFPPFNGYSGMTFRTPEGQVTASNYELVCPEAK